MSTFRFQSPNMTDAKRKAKILLLEQNKTFADVAKDAGLALATVHNVLDGRKSSRKSKEAITNALGVQIFEDVPVTEKWFTWLPGEIEIGSPTVADAIASVRQFPKGTVRRRGRVVYVVKPIRISIPRHADRYN